VRIPALGLALGVGIDALLGDPRRGHPVALFGTAAGALEKRMYADSRARGAAYTAVCVGATAALGAAADRLTRRRPAARVAVTAAATWAVLGGTTLRREARAIAAPLTAGDLAAARERLPYLVGRDPSGLDETGIARAVVESVAENTSDAVVAPLFWGAVAGLPGLLAYRAVNTLDAMIGYRGRFEYLGKASARLDDLLNLIPARLTAACVLLAGALSGARAREGLRIWRRDARKTESPNAGHPMAAMAGLLGVQLEKRGCYALGDAARAPEPCDVARAWQIVSRAAWIALGLALVASLELRHGLG
jgi:adenosylcobinamide-phosphate synthase